MCLLDTNIFIELLLDQDRANEVEQLLCSVSVDFIHISEFTLYLIGLLLTRRGLSEAFSLFVSDVIPIGGIQLIRSGPQHMHSIMNVLDQMNLDFNDSDQYVVAEYDNLAIVIFDTDFDRTIRGRITPTEVLLREQTS